jgi:hypothetical protein
VLHLTLQSTYAHLPEPEPRLSVVIVLSIWAAAAGLYLSLIVYGVFISPLHLFIPSPMDAWTRYSADPEAVQDFYVHYEPGAKTDVE